METKHKNDSIVIIPTYNEKENIEAIIRAVIGLEKGFDVVYAVPKKLPHSWWRNLGSRMTKIVLGKIMGMRINTRLHAKENVDRFILFGGKPIDGAKFKNIVHHNVTDARTDCTF